MRQNQVMKDFRLGPWHVQPSLQRLVALDEPDGEGVRPIGAKPLGVLLGLAERPGEALTKDELVARAWDGDAASDEALTTVIYELRRALDDDARKPRFIGTIRGRGYRLLIPPTRVPDGDGESLAQPAPTPSSLRGSWQPAGRRAAPVWVSLAGAGLAASLAGAVVAGLTFVASLAAPPSLPSVGQTAGMIETKRSVAVFELESREPPDTPQGDASTPLPAPLVETHELFARGLSERLAIDLARSEWLEVLPAFSSVFEPTSSTPGEGTDAVLEGAVRQLGERSLVTVQLVAADGQLLWGGSWERAEGELAALEGELAALISRRVRAHLGDAEVLAREGEARRYAAGLSQDGRHSRAIALLQAALDDAPSLERRLDLARAFYLARRFDDALDEIEAARRLAPEDPRPAQLEGDVRLLRGELAAAVAACREALALAGGPEEVLSTLDRVFDQAGLGAVVRCLESLDLETPALDPLRLARYEAAGGDQRAALRLLEQARAGGSPELRWLPVDPAFDGLRGSAAFDRLTATCCGPAASSV